MPERFKTQRYEERESSKVGLWEYVTKHVPFVLLPFVGFAAGLALRKTTKIPFLEAPQGMFGKTAKDVAAAAAQTGQYVMRRAEGWGLLLGGAYSTYHLWSSNTKEQLEVEKITADVEKLRGMESGSQYLARENEQLRQQIRFSERHEPHGASHASHVEASKENAAEAAR
jgi:hypothetical protein